MQMLNKKELDMHADNKTASVLEDPLPICKIGMQGSRT
jgi:hypothetical protein